MIREVKHFLYPLATTAILLAITACDSIDRQAEPSGTATQPPATPSQTAPSPASSEDYPEVEIPETSGVLVPVMHGTTGADTPTFSVPAMKYTIYIACTGKGTLSVDRVPQPFHCDGVIDRHHVMTADRSHVVAIRPNGAVRWSVGVGDGSDFNFTTPTPTPPSG